MPCPYNGLALDSSSRVQPCGTFDEAGRRYSADHNTWFNETLLMCDLCRRDSDQVWNQMQYDGREW